MKIWIDDVRSPPSDKWVWVKNSFDALRVIKGNWTGITLISFDHDLGGDDTSVRVADFIEEMAARNVYRRFEWDIHSANPVGRNRLKQALDKADEYWTRNELLEKE